MDYTISESVIIILKQGDHYDNHIQGRFAGRGV